MKVVAAPTRRPSMARPSISFAGRRRGERRADRPRGATRPSRRDRAGRRLDDRLGHLHRLGRHRAPPAGARLAARGVGHRRGAHRGGRAHLRAPRRRHAARRRPVRLPDRAVGAAVGLPLRLDARARHSNRHDRGRGRGLRDLRRAALAGARAGGAACPPRAARREPGAGSRGRRDSAAHRLERARPARRTVPRALVLGTGLVCGLYLVTNVAYLNVLPLVGTKGGADAVARGIQHASADRVGAAAMERLAGGSLGATLMALAVMVSTFGCANGLVLAGARVAWAMAGDGLFFARAARLNDRHVPGPALWMQGAWASVLALSGRYGDLLDYVIVAELLFYLLTVGGLLVLARRTGERPRGTGYPWLQVAYLVLVTALVVDLLITKPAYTWGSVAVVASGVPFYALWRPRART